MTILNTSFCRKVKILQHIIKRPMPAPLNFKKGNNIRNSIRNFTPINVEKYYPKAFLMQTTGQIWQK